jgi:hypothetical protein
MTGLSNHGAKRLRKRKGISKANLEADFARALEHGLRQKDMKGRMKKHVNWLCREYQSDAVYYQNFLYFFKQGVLVTTYPLEPKYRKYLLR